MTQQNRCDRLFSFCPAARSVGANSYSARITFLQADLAPAVVSTDLWFFNAKSRNPKRNDSRLTLFRRGSAYGTLLGCSGRHTVGQRT